MLWVREAVRVVEEAGRRTRERLHHLGGLLEIEAAPAGGTRALISVLLTPRKADRRPEDEP